MQWHYATKNHSSSHRSSCTHSRCGGSTPMTAWSAASLARRSVRSSPLCSSFFVSRRVRHDPIQRDLQRSAIFDSARSATIRYLTSSLAVLVTRLEYCLVGHDLRWRLRSQMCGYEAVSCMAQELYYLLCYFIQGPQRRHWSLTYCVLEEGHRR